MEEAGSPVGAATVVLLDQNSKQVAGTLTDASGNFLVRAPAPGHYSLRAERVGYTSTVSPVLDLRANEEHPYRLVVRDEPVALAEIRVDKKERRCTVRPGANLEMAALWEEARKAINAAALAQDQNLFRYEVAQFERDLNVNSEQIQKEDRRTARGLAHHPFVSIPADELSRGGYIQTKPDGTFYYAPDAHVLLSDAFLEDHCFHIVVDGAAGDSLIGLGFEPVRGRKVPEIRGVLWLQRATAELKHLEFSYVNTPLKVNTDKLGGRLDFDRLPEGPWIVRRWRIRMPAVAVETGRRRNMDESSFTAYRTEVLAGIRETGGEVLTAMNRSGAPLLATAGAVMEGTVWDSTRMQPLAGARVYLPGTQFATTTNARGQFRMGNLPTGTYAVSFSHPELSRFITLAPPYPVALQPSSTTSVELAVPGWEQIVAAVCPSETPRRTPRGVLVGRVLSPGTNAPIAKAQLSATWQRASGEDITAEADADVEGFFALCGMPEDTPLRITTRTADRHLDGGEVRLDPGLPLRMDLQLTEQRFAGGADTIGTVPLPRIDAAAQPATEFERRVRRGTGVYITRADIEKHKFTRTTDVFRMVPGVELIAAGSMGSVVRFRGRGSPAPRGISSIPRNPETGNPITGGDIQSGNLTPRDRAKLSDPQQQRKAERQIASANAGVDVPADCPPDIYLDGTRWNPSFPGELDTIRPDEIEGIEFYKSAATAPAQYKRLDAVCGVILIWTRSQR